MKTIENHNVKIFTDNIEESAIEQIRQLLSVDVFSNCKIRIMPDVHAGAGCVIGFTGNLGDRVIPNIVGVDIGCGIMVQPFVCNKELNDSDYHELNQFILHNIPSGRDYRNEKYAELSQKYTSTYRESKEIIKQLKCYRYLNDTKRLNKSIGSLGGGNHFIELDKDNSGMFYLVIHTGSRNLGKQVANFYQKLTVKCQSGWDELMRKQNEMIAAYKAEGRRAELQDAVRELHNSFKMRRPSIPVDLCYLEGEFRDDYLHDMKLCQRWAQLNRSLIRGLIMDLFIKNGYVENNEPELEKEAFESIHNYISDDNMIRKGAISAHAGEKCIIPLNMSDGSLICIYNHQNQKSSKKKTKSQ